MFLPKCQHLHTVQCCWISFWRPYNTHTHTLHHAFFWCNRATLPHSHTGLYARPQAARRHSSLHDIPAKALEFYQAVEQPPLQFWLGATQFHSNLKYWVKHGSTINAKVWLVCGILHFMLFSATNSTIAKNWFGIGGDFDSVRSMGRKRPTTKGSRFPCRPLLRCGPSGTKVSKFGPTKEVESILYMVLIILWMDETLHHLRAPRVMVPL